MNYLTATKTGLLKTFDINGRASRSEFWWCSLNVFAAFIIYEPLVKIIPYFGIIPLLFSLSLTTCSIRRLRDTNRSWIFILLNLIPGFGTILLIILLVKPSEPEGSIKPIFGSIKSIFSSGWLERSAAAMTKFNNAMEKAVREREAERVVKTNVIACPKCGASSSYPSSRETHSCTHCRSVFEARYNRDGSLDRIGS